MEPVQREQARPARPPQAPSDEALLESIRLISESPITSALLEAFHGLVLVLDERRRIVATNRELERVLGGADAARALGLRPGAMLGCSLAENRAGGCGLGEACAACGCAQAVVQARERGVAVEQEFLLSVRRDGGLVPLELLARATPVALGGREFVVLTLSDISDRKRRQALEQVFFHDLLNTAGGLRGWAELMRAQAGADADPATGRIVSMTWRLVDEVRAHRDLLEAEAGTLKPVVEPVPVDDVLGEVRALFAGHPAAADRLLQVLPDIDGVTLTTSRSLLARVLINMVKNALEAVPAGGVVRLWFERDVDGKRCAFKVHNAGAIPRNLAARIFQRSFSTKGMPGRGLGTYSMKLFGETHLGGEVGFTSDEARGTEFFLSLPLGGR